MPVFENGKRVFQVGANGGFRLIVEARPGLNGRTVGTFLPAIIPGQTQRPDLQILSSRPLGNGSTVVCDTSSHPSPGGVPATDSPDFNPTQAVTDALLDLACRFDPVLPSSPCTLNRNGLEAVITQGGLPSSGRQFCNVVTPLIGFPLGDTTLTIQVRDNQGVPGPQQQIIVRRTQ